ncbi:hypothetical protein [Spirosoma koreense]
MTKVKEFKSTFTPLSVQIIHIPGLACPAVPGRKFHNRQAERGCS